MYAAPQNALFMTPPSTRSATPVVAEARALGPLGRCEFVDQLGNRRNSPTRSKRLASMATTRWMVRHLAIGVAASLGGTLLLQAPACNAFEGDTLYAKPGQFFTADDGAKLNFYCMGRGSPTVVFESGEGDWSPSWVTVQPAVSGWTRTCSYDRAGAGFSGPGPLPSNDKCFAAELYSALRNGGVGAPYILVGHASGGDIVRVFADLYMSDVAGMVLIDPAERDVETTHDLDDIWRGIDERNRGRLTFCRDAVAGKSSPFTPPPDHPGWTCLGYSFRGVSDPRFSPTLNDALVRIMSTKVAMYEALLSGVGQRASEKSFGCEVSPDSSPLPGLSPLARHSGGL